MKQALLIITLIGLAAGSFPATAAEQTRSFAVAKMDCPVCPVTVKKAIEKVEGVVTVTVDYDTKTATVTFDDETATVDELAEASTNAGYPATLIQTSS